MAIKIFIDQGHNPQNPNAGAEGNGYREQDLVYEIGALLAELLQINPNFEVMLSRPTPETVLGSSNSGSLRSRVQMAAEFGADYFISLHANASTVPTASGSEAYVYSYESPALELAEDILDSLAMYTGIASRGVFSRPTLYVLRRTPMPATLLELGFITNPEEAALMADQPGLFATGIYEGILNFFGMD